jgi:hypothetical protein
MPDNSNNHLPVEVKATPELPNAKPTPHRQASEHGGVIRTQIPGRLDRLPWSSWHWLILISLEHARSCRSIGFGGYQFSTRINNSSGLYRLTI